MSTTIAPHHFGRRQVPLAAALTGALLGCGVVYAAVYVVANDVIAAGLYPGYSRVDQAVSELSAIGAPSAPLLRAMLPVFTALMLGYAIGVWRAAHGSRALHVTSALLVVSAAVGISWLWFPMTSRQDIVPGAPFSPNDLGHLVLSGLTVALILSQMAIGALALGKWFRFFSVFAAVTMLTFGVVMSVGAAGVSAGQATPWMGLNERIMLGAWLAWISAFAIALMRQARPMQ